MEQVLSILAEGPIGLDVDAFIGATAPNLGFLESEHPERLIRALVSLNVTRAHSDYEIVDFIDNVLRSLDEAKPPLILTGQTRDRARVRLTTLLSSEPLSSNVRAVHLQQDHDRLLVHSRILTDARPVFGSDVKNAPVTMLITQTLKLTYFQDGKTMEFYTALDAEDIAELKEVLVRAENKADSLANIFTLAKVPLCRK